MYLEEQEVKRTEACTKFADRHGINLAFETIADWNLETGRYRMLQLAELAFGRDFLSLFGIFGSES